MIGWVIAAAVGFACQAVFALAGVVTRQEMINLVNPHLPAEQRYRTTGAHPRHPPGGLASLYQRLYPDGRLARQYRWRAALSMAAFFFWVGCLALYGYLTGRR